jgi:hypothetical protein
MSSIKKSLSDITSNKNFINIKIPFQYLILITGTYLIILVSFLSFLYHKLSIANKSIENLQNQQKSFNNIIQEFQKKNEKLLESLNNLTLKNQQMERLVEELQSENATLLDTISKIGSNKMTSSLFADPNTYLKIFFGLAVLGVATYGGCTFVSFINAKYANSSIGLLIAGIDKKLLWLGTKTGIIRLESTQTLMDQYYKTYVVELIDYKVCCVSIKHGENLVEIGSHINRLFEKINTQQTLIDVLTIKAEGLGTQSSIEALDFVATITKEAVKAGLFLS